MDRIVGIETEYGCLLSEEESHVNSEVWPAKVKNYLFRKAQAGMIVLHSRDYEHPRATEASFSTAVGSISTWVTSSTHRRTVCICAISLPTTWLVTSCSNRLS